MLLGLQLNLKYFHAKFYIKGSAEDPFSGEEFQGKSEFSKIWIWLVIDELNN